MKKNAFFVMKDIAQMEKVENVNLILLYLMKIKNFIIDVIELMMKGLNAKFVWMDMS